eukprot:TRINITY_DN329_c0_g1_i1.p1 TRINITY_DN329_c0_g1~~TRINITY_DN329_c0_g1_i1.p1  ORF type:complete len:211 (+),score=5.53 TRINITY_DN329_c0_g1_i1:168-800(+)
MSAPTEKTTQPSVVVKKPRTSTNVWNQALLTPLRNPETTAGVVRHTKQVVIIHDKYPKSQLHWLVLARDESLNAVDDLKPEHIPLVEHMIAEAQAALNDAAEGVLPEYKIRFGFHAVPSMKVLHMHVISQDFDSTCLKNKKHVNSFMSSFFLDANDVLETLRSGRAVTIDRDDAEALLKADMQCPRCGAPLRNMPAVKQHMPCTESNTVK